LTFLLEAETVKSGRLHVTKVIWTVKWKRKFTRPNFSSSRLYLDIRTSIKHIDILR
jgi:hypothetical protein